MRVDRILAVSQYLADQAIKYGADPKIIAVKPNPVPDPGPPSPAPARLTFIYAGRLEAQKGVLELLEAWRRADLDADLHLVGDGELRHLVDSATADRRVYAHGNLSRVAVSELIAKSSVAVVPSTWPETFGLVAVEAMARGRPVLATRVGGLPEVVGDVGGWLVDPTVDAIRFGLREASTADKKRMGALARRRYLDNYAPDVVAAALIRHYEIALSTV